MRVVLKQMNDVADPGLLPVADAFFARNPDLPTSGHPPHDVDSGLLCREFVAYATEIGRHGKGHFDVVVIDGMARGLSTWMAVNYIKTTGSSSSTILTGGNIIARSKFCRNSASNGSTFTGWGRAGRSSGARRFFCVISILSRSLVN